MKTNELNFNGINPNAQCIGGQTLKEWLGGETLESAIYNTAHHFENSIEEGIADSLMYDKAYAPEWYKAEMQNMHIIIPNKETREYILSLIAEK